MFYHWINLSSIIILLIYNIQRNLRLKTTDAPKWVNYLDLRLEFDEDGRFTHDLDKRDELYFPIVKFPYLSRAYWFPHVVQEMLTLSGTPLWNSWFHPFIIYTLQNVSVLGLGYGLLTDLAALYRTYFIWHLNMKLYILIFCRKTILVSPIIFSSLVLNTSGNTHCLP